MLTYQIFNSILRFTKKVSKTFIASCFLLLCSCMTLRAQYEPKAYWTFESGTLNNIPLSGGFPVPFPAVLRPTYSYTPATEPYTKNSINGGVSNPFLYFYARTTPSLIQNDISGGLVNNAYKVDGFLGNTNYICSEPFDINNATDGLTLEFLMKINEMRGRIWIGYSNISSATANYYDVSQISPTSDNPSMSIFFELGEDYIAIPEYRLIPGDPASVRKVIPLNGVGKKSIGYYVDGEWHHIVVKKDMNSATDNIELWIDGERPCQDFIASQDQTIPITTTKNILMTGFGQLSGELDEIAFYDKPLTDRLILKHRDKLMSGNHLNNTDFTNTPPYTLPPASPSNYIGSAYDPFEFVASDNTATKAIRQVKLFPIPRFKLGHTLRRNSGGNVSLGTNAIIHDSLDWYYNDFAGCTTPECDATGAGVMHSNSYHPVDLYTSWDYHEVLDVMKERVENFN